MAHDHSHAHHAHAHTHAPRRDGERRLFWVLVLTAVFMVAEVVGGVLSGSLALIADAGHMLSDTAALALAWAAFRVARRPHDEKRSSPPLGPGTACANAAAVTNAVSVRRVGRSIAVQRS